MIKIIKIILLLVLSLPIPIQKIYADEKIKIGLLVPLSGKNAEIGQSIVKATQLAINKINDSSIEIIPKDTESSPETTLRSALELNKLGVELIIGPVFNESLTYLDELKNITFLSLTNKIIDNPKNIISAGINASSQLKTIKKFLELNEINKTIFLTPDVGYKSVTTSLLYTDISPKQKYFITLNQWFDESLLNETSSQPIYFPSINKENYEKFQTEYYKKFKQYPNQLSFLSFDLVGLVYYLLLQNDSIIDEKIFSKKAMFKGKVGIFEINKNKINHILNFYKVENKEFKKIF